MRGLKFKTNKTFFNLKKSKSLVKDVTLRSIWCRVDRGQGYKYNLESFLVAGISGK